MIVHPGGLGLSPVWFGSAAEQEPVDYWKMGFPPTQEVERINEQARVQKDTNRQFQEKEAE